MNSRLIARYVFREITGLVIMGVALFWSAGRIDWWPAWAALGVTLGWITATAAVILRSNPALLAERLGPRKGAKLWDTAILSFLGMGQLVRYVVAGLDHRYGWTALFPIAAQVVALIICALGYALMTWALASNRFFSQIVRVQSERGHSVATGGPYQYVRHPAYLGAILYEFAVSILLASWWSLILSGFGAILLVLRTALEDRTLRVELDGYSGYAQQVPYRLLPSLW